MHLRDSWKLRQPVQPRQHVLLFDNAIITEKACGVTARSWLADQTHTAVIQFCFTSHMLHFVYWVWLLGACVRNCCVRSCQKRCCHAVMLSWQACSLKDFMLQCIVLLVTNQFVLTVSQCCTLAVVYHGLKWLLLASSDTVGQACLYVTSVSWSSAAATMLGRVVDADEFIESRYCKSQSNAWCLSVLRTMLFA